MSQSAVCIDSTYTWTSNSLGQSPCVVGAYLASACTSSPPVVNAQLQPNGHYDAPSPSTACTCSIEYYSAISACAACQDGQYLNWSEWTKNCPSTYTSFPEPIPGGTQRPLWACLSIGSDGFWNKTAAQIEAVSEAQSTGASGYTTLTGNAYSTLSGNAYSTLSGNAYSTLSGNAYSTLSGNAYSTITGYPSSTTTSAITTGNPGGNAGGGSVQGGIQQSKSTNVGAIVGGVVGGFCGLVALLGILLFRRRIFNRLAPPSLTNAGQHPDDAPPGYSELGGTMRTSGPPMRLYDPSDPLTFPLLVNAPTTNGSGQPAIPSEPALRPVHKPVLHADIRVNRSYGLTTNGSGQPVIPREPALHPVHKPAFPAGIRVNRN